MAKRSAQDTAAAKAKKQKNILIIGGVLLLAVAVFQGPKLMKRGGSSAAPAAGRRPERDGTPVPAPSRPRPRQGSAVVAGVALPRGAAVKVETSQLASFTLFEVKDPSSRRWARVGADADRTLGRPGRRLDRTSTLDVARLHRLGARRTGRRGRAGTVIYATIDFNSKPQQVR